VQREFVVKFVYFKIKLILPTFLFGVSSVSSMTRQSYLLAFLFVTLCYSSNIQWDSNCVGDYSWEGTTPCWIPNTPDNGDSITVDVAGVNLNVQNLVKIQSFNLLQGRVTVTKTAVTQTGGFYVGGENILKIFFNN
jgi:hypothetical protein